MKLQGVITLTFTRSNKNCMYYLNVQAVPRLRWLVLARFCLRPVRTEFVDQVALGWVILWVFRVSFQYHSTNVPCWLTRIADDTQNVPVTNTVKQHPWTFKTGWNTTINHKCTPFYCSQLPFMDNTILKHSCDSCSKLRRECQCLFLNFFQFSANKVPHFLDSICDFASHLLILYVWFIPGLWKIMLYITVSFLTLIRNL